MVRMMWWLRLREWADRNLPRYTQVQWEDMLDKHEKRVDEITTAFFAGKDIGAWECFRTIDELQRVRTMLAQAAIDGNTLAQDLLNRTVANPLPTGDKEEWDHE